MDMDKLHSLALDELVSLIEYHNGKYWQEGEPEISDEEYDLLIRALEKLSPEHPLLSQVHAVEVESDGKVRHTVPMLSLDKAYSLNEVLAWAEKFARNAEEKLLVQPKYDGISAIWKEGVLATRGDGEVGEDITAKVPLIELEHPKGVMPLGSFREQARGEIVIRTDDFKNLYSHIRNKNGKTYKNSRNAVAGIMGLKDIAPMLLQHAKLSLIDYSLYSHTLPLKELAGKWGDLVLELEALPYPMDGIVIKLADTVYMESLGNTAHHPRGQIAFKFSGVRKETKLLNIQWSFGKTALTPVAEIEEVEIGGTTIKNVSLHNLQNILDKDIQIGDKVVVERAGDVIPYILSSSPGEERKKNIPEFCPSCGEKLFWELPELCCKNPHCPETNLARLLASVKNIGIEHLGEPNIRKMMTSLHVKTLGDIFALTVADILTLPGFAGKSAENLYNEIQSARNVPDYQLLASLNIKGIGQNIAKTILKSHTLEELENMTIEALSLLDGIGPERAAALYGQLRENKSFLEELNTILSIRITKEDGEKTARPTICFTGKMPRKRSFYEELARSNGYEAVDSVTSDLSLLVAAGEESNSSKYKKAQKYGVKILSLDEFLASLAGEGEKEEKREEDDLFAPPAKKTPPESGEKENKEEKEEELTLFNWKE